MRGLFPSLLFVNLAPPRRSWLRCVRYKRKQPRLLRHIQFREPPHGAKLTQSARACHRELKRASSRAGRAGAHEMGPAAQTGLRPRHARPQQGRNSYLTQLRLTGSAHWRYTSAQKKRWFKIPIHSNRVDDERRCDAGVRTMVSICSIPNDSAATREVVEESAPTERGVACVA